MKDLSALSVKLPNGSSSAATDEVVKRIEDAIERMKVMWKYTSVLSVERSRTWHKVHLKANIAEISVKLVPLTDRERSVFEFVDDVQPEVLKTVGDDAKVGFDVQTAAGSSPNTLTFSLKDTDEARLNEAVTEIEQ